MFVSHCHAVLCSCGRLRLKFSPTCLSVSCPIPKCYDTLPLVTVLNGRRRVETDVEWPESGSAILVFTCPPDYCTWQSLPPIASRYLRRLSNLPVCLSVSKKGLNLLIFFFFAFSGMFMVACYTCICFSKEEEWKCQWKCVIMNKK